MIFGLSPKHTRNLTLGTLTAEEFLVVAIEVAKQLKWHIRHISENGFVAYTKVLHSSWSEEIKVRIEGDKVYLISECTGDRLIDFGKNRKNIQQFVYAIHKLKSEFTAEELIQKLEELQPNFAPKDHGLLDIPLSIKQKIKGVFGVFIPTEGYFITPILLLLNVAVYIMMVSSGVNIFSPTPESLVNWGANFRPYTLDGDWWRLLTSFFLHSGLHHLMGNMLILFFIGVMLEPFLGKTRFLAAYLLTGLAGSTASLWWHDMGVCTGASGAIFGMYGVFLALLTTNLIDKIVRDSLLISIAVFVVFNISSGFLSYNIDNAAHIGGLLSGFIVGYSFLPSLRNPGSVDLKNGIIGIMAGLFVFGSFIVYQSFSKEEEVFRVAHIEEYDYEIEGFLSMARIAERATSAKNTSKEDELNTLKGIAIYYWAECINVLDNLSKLSLPKEIKEQNKLLKKFCVLKIKSCELRYARIYEDTTKYDIEIEKYNKEIMEMGEITDILINYFEL